jgi:hypothetical protein
MQIRAVGERIPVSCELPATCGDSLSSLLCRELELVVRPIAFHLHRGWGVNSGVRWPGPDFSH